MRVRRLLTGNVKLVDITVKVKSLIQTMANKLGYEIYRLPPFTPPSNIRTIVGPFSDARYYQEVREEFFRYFKDLCALKPTEDVLDVGCGCGQMAGPLTEYLDANAKYEGFDIVGILVKWCMKNISSKYPNFRFQLADVFNKGYNPNGQYKASEYKFPYENETFDFVFVKSVFTHMLPQDMENYLSEIVRVLKKGAKCLISYFLLNTQSLELVDAKLSTLDFRCVFENYRTLGEIVPEDAVAYAEEYINKLYEKFGLDIVNPIHYGSWCGRKSYLSYQDIVIASKG